MRKLGCAGNYVHNKIVNLSTTHPIDNSKLLHIDNRDSSLCVDHDGILNFANAFIILLRVIVPHRQHVVFG